jgi:hypothetical protein
MVFTKTIVIFDYFLVGAGIVGLGLLRKRFKK